MKIGVVGLGYWGPNLVRNFSAAEKVDSVVACDVDRRRLQSIGKKFPTATLEPDMERLFSDDSVEALAIATPVSTHFQLAKEAMENGKHVLLEKPLAATTAEAEYLVNLAAKKGVVLMVDHTFIYTAAVRKMRQLIDNGEIGRVSYFDSVRVNLGLFQHDVNVVWDLATHDISIMHYLVHDRPVSVAAFGSAHYNGHEDIAYVVVNFNDGLMAHFHVNWLAPVKVRQILIGGTKKMIMYDDVEPSEKVKVYDKGVTAATKEGIYDTLIQYRTGDMYAPHLDGSEALSLLCSNFVRTIAGEATALTDGNAGLEVVRILEAANKSLKNHGVLVALD